VSNTDGKANKYDDELRA